MMKLNICMITYNHEKYIEQAVRSVMMQETDFEYKLMVSDDCSTDKTREILNALENEFPGKIELILNESNIGVMPNFIAALRACRSKYIALLEGDDFWTNPGKLQMQVDILDGNPGIAYSSHNATIRFEHPNPDKICSIPFNSRKMSTINSIDNLINEWFTHMSTIVLRSKCINNLPDWMYEVLNGDYTLALLVATQGDIYYIDKFMSTYRRHGEGFSQIFPKNFGLKEKAQIDMFTRFNIHTDNKYIKTIHPRIMQLHNDYYRKSQELIRKLREEKKKS
jgi:glycosyltransferase involved in cell wall biosynthesis